MRAHLSLSLSQIFARGSTYVQYTIYIHTIFVYCILCTLYPNWTTLEASICAHAFLFSPIFLLHLFVKDSTLHDMCQLDLIRGIHVCTVLSFLTKAFCYRLHLMWYITIGLHQKHPSLMCILG